MQRERERDTSPNLTLKRVHDHCILQYQHYNQSKGEELASAEEKASLVISEDGKPVEQRLNHTCRDASPNKKRVRDHCILQYQQSKGKELAQKASLNGVAIGEKQIILRDHYDKDHPGLPGGVTGVLELFGTAAAGWSIKQGLSKLWEFGKNMIMGKKESSEDKLERFFTSFYTTGLAHIKDATNTHDDKQQVYHIREAANNFMTAVNTIKTGDFVKAKSMLSIAACNHWLREYDVAEDWLNQAYEEGRAERTKFHSRYELTQFEDEFMKPLEKLRKSYPPTSDRAIPLLPQFSRPEIGSSSTSDRVDKRELQNKVSTLESQLNRAERKIQNLERTTRFSRSDNGSWSDSDDDGIELDPQLSALLLTHLLLSALDSDDSGSDSEG